MAHKRRSPTILVADDDALIRGNLATLLRSEGYEVREAADGSQADAVLRGQQKSSFILDLLARKLELE